MHVENNLSPEDRQGIENYLIILNTISFLGDLNIKYNNHNAKIKNYSSGYCKYYCKIA
ncbi:hypothetical protein ABT242_000367 [Campylobacter jejuni]|uniref:hypothetical protein n=1 Tax=Campylobacter TaxID=194 RepID=UPI000257EE39|nr:MULTISPECIES: hypothetical protein [Campylobacter]MBZ7939837.1 hypothetical protein [Campylobacter sp. W0014]WPM69511.1 hypothetical protein OT343_05250 [Campylobacter sp. CFSAN122719]AON68927.1 hypothetical protein MTVDSCj16_1160 [Campylobacter jejuni subsp. jejuni]APA79502.1 hypothetical protein CJM129_5085 [Campylobacter jejuni subsp. jejuni M129]ATE68990.1 Uncharacterized protein CMV38_1084 [Campylobacter jejuni]